MPIDLSALPPKADPVSTSPWSWRWAVVCLVVMTGGMLAMLLAWPKSQPTNTPLFWIAVVGGPFMAAAFCAVLRLAHHAGLERDAASWDAVRDAHVAMVFERGSKPLILLAVAYRFAATDSENSVSSIADGSLVLGSRPTVAKDGAVEARWLDAPPVNQGEHPDAYDRRRQHLVLGATFTSLLDTLAPALARLPARIPLRVQLHVSAPAAQSDVVRLWNELWKHRQRRDAQFMVGNRAPDLMSMDTWLDQSDGEERDHATLLVVINLHDLVSHLPPRHSAEMAVALLLTSADVAQQNRLTPVAYVHRPVAGTTAALASTLEYALKWGRASADEISHLWHAGFDEVGKAALRNAARGGGVVLNQEGRPSGEHDLGQTVGHGAAATDWFAIACAAEYARTFGGPQLVARHNGEQAVLGVVRAPVQVTSFSGGL